VDSSLTFWKIKFKHWRWWAGLLSPMLLWAIPVKEGLRHIFPAIFSPVYHAREGIPAKEGLRHFDLKA